MIDNIVRHKFSIHTDIVCITNMPFLTMVEVGHNIWIHPDTDYVFYLSSKGFELRKEFIKKPEWIDRYKKHKEEDLSELESILKHIKDDK